MDRREHYIPDVAALFTEDEIVDSSETYGYETTARMLSDRLDILGFSSSRAASDLRAAVATGREANGAIKINDEALDRRVIAVFQDLRAYVNSVDEFAAYDEPRYFFELDARTILRLALDCLHDRQAVVRYNLDDLANRGFLPRGRAITAEARAEWRDRATRDAPLVILTEGTSDAALLSAGLEVTHPHLSQYLRFMDFSGRAEGGASALVNLVRSFIGAGIANRVLAIFDNDTAAYDATRRLKRENLPSGYRVVHYPDIPLLTRYPTLGPHSQSPVYQNVNGTAGGVEMYLGRELLTSGGELVPVQWTGYISGLKAYQGALPDADKRRVQEAFHAKVRRVVRDDGAMAGEDWSGIEAIGAQILGAYSPPI